MPLGLRTDFPEASGDRPSRTVSQTDSGVYMVRRFHPVNAKRGIGKPMECEDRVVAAPRCDGVTSVVFRNPNTLSH